MRPVRGVLLGLLLLSSCAPAPEPDADVELGNLVVVAPERLSAGTSVLAVRNADTAHHTLTVCPGGLGRCDGTLVAQRVLRQPEDARDPDSLPDTPESLVLGGGWDALVEVDLEPGRYRFYCAIVNHAARGMETVVEVS